MKKLWPSQVIELLQASAGYGRAEMVTKGFITLKPSHSFDKYLLSPYDKPGTVAGTRDARLEWGEKLVNKYSYDIVGRGECYGEHTLGEGDGGNWRSGWGWHFIGGWLEASLISWH